MFLPFYRQFVYVPHFKIFQYMYLEIILWYFEIFFVYLPSGFSGSPLDSLSNLSSTCKTESVEFSQKQKRNTTHEKGLNSHQLLIVWKVPRRLTWESLGGRRLQKMCFVFANIEKVSKRIRRQQKEVFRKYWESLAYDKIWESHRKFKTVSWIKKITFSPKNRPSVRSNDKRFSEKSLKQSSYILNANKPNQQDVKTKIIMF